MAADEQTTGGRPSADMAAIKDLFGAVIEARSGSGFADSDHVLREAKPSVRAAVEALLAAHRRASGILLDDTLNTGAAETPDVASAAGSATPTVVGYEIDEELGHGGFGIVYAARQRTPIDRPVAVKVLRRELVSHDAIARFRAESIFLARMSHESIAKVYDAGLTPTKGNRSSPWS